MTETIVGLSAIGLTAGITQIIKGLEIIPSRYIPLVALATGIVLVFLGGSEVSWKINLLQGIALGLATMGAYSGTKKVLNK